MAPHPHSCHLKSHIHQFLMTTRYEIQKFDSGPGEYSWGTMEYDKGWLGKPACDDMDIDDLN